MNQWFALPEKELWRCRSDNAALLSIDRQYPAPYRG
uniref:Uncharacterized protein n=1 Tax=Anguilla anguilla TaxID=7936 RepID=A0A0E9TSH6_ANGAN